MRIYFSFLFGLFSLIASGQSGFNQPKSVINEPLKVQKTGIDSVRVVDSVRVWFDKDTTINPIIREIRDSISRQNIILMNQSTPTIMAATPSYTSNRTLFTANTTPAAYSVGVPANTREITIQNITGADIQITTSQGTQILGAKNNITLSNPNNTTINHAVFTGNITISFFSSVLDNIGGVAPRVIIDFKAY